MHVDVAPAMAVQDLYGELFLFRVPRLNTHRDAAVLDLVFVVVLVVLADPSRQ